MSQFHLLRKTRSRRCAGLLLAATLVAGCTDEPVMPERGSPPPSPAPQVLGYMLVTFDGIGTPDFNASALTAPTIEALEERIAEHERLRQLGDDVSLDFTPPPGDGTLQLRFNSDPSGLTFDANGQRWIHANFSVRNAQADSTPYTVPLDNLTFVTVSTRNTLAQTPIRILRNADGNALRPVLAWQVMPAGVVSVENGELVSTSPDALQILTEDEVAAITPTSPRIRSVFPYAFMVRNANDNTTRTLPANPGPDQFDGAYDMTWRFPLQPDSADNPAQIAYVHMILQDSETRLTQSIEEQSPAGRAAFEQRASSLGADTVTVLPGGAAAGPFDVRTLCSVRTAGNVPNNPPAAYLVNIAGFQSFGPTANSMVAANASFQATFSEAAFGVGPNNFTVRGLQSGPAFRDSTYSGNSTTMIMTPQANFFPGEEVEIVLTGPCPQPHVARYRVAAGPGGGSFSDTTNFDTGVSPTSVAIADLNGNGILDVVTANQGENNVSVLLGSGDGTFQPGPQQPFDLGGRPTSVRSGDLNGDGILDLVTSNDETGNVSVLLGNGDGSFQPQQPFDVGSFPESVAIGDLNGNGILDIVTANGGDSNVSVLLGNGDGTFEPQDTFDLAGEPTSVAIGDLNGNGILDLATTWGDSNVSVLLGSGDGTFQPGPQQPSGLEGLPESVAIGDLNGNGIVDLVTANVPGGNVNVPGNVSVLLGNGDGTFQQDTTFGVGDGPTSVTLGDLNGNGVLDVATTNLATSDVSVLLGNGDGTFQPQQTFGIGSGAESVRIGDLNGDGILDLVTAAIISTYVSVLLGSS